MAAFHYVFSVDKYSSKGVTAEIAAAECTRLEHSEGGLTPKTLLDASRSVDAPLHSIFEWDDLIAAEKYREGQAQELIINLRIAIDDGGEEPVKVRAFENKPEGHSAYGSIASALTNSEWRDMMLQQAADEAKLYIAKYHNLEALQMQIEALKQFVDSRG